MTQEIFEFILPVGIPAGDTVCKKGTMRLATAGDEISAGRDPLVKESADYLPLVTLSKVISFEGKGKVTPIVLENLKTSDLTFLKNMYNTINETEALQIQVTCPHCGKGFSEPVNFIWKV